MKKVLLFISTLLLLSCSGSDDSPSINNNNNDIQTLSPPEWIQGTWGNITDGVTFKNFRFTSHNAYWYNGNSEMEIFNQYAINNVEEETTSAKYYLTYVANGTTIRYYFDKVNDSKIRLQNISLPDAIQRNIKIED